jgi:hypothetical protein
LADEAGLRRPPEVPMLGQRHQVLKVAKIHPFHLQRNRLLL